ncbi:helix-turn-helix transcriptional regulator [Lactobacillus sp. ESL0679]|uniref:helix-turn-helix transcriptional regulator n=1 Tax=Lactobacillus sp. ESL0679 TaxID=2983209 RepID=UPI0023F7A5EE|nr:helix-turn-helix transcriptional regulator [Lactobacillus sp. ESL0679]MDF7682688.1 helix-turn-helix transcriptional regulator [Lactobacillus sp. ESL0679]
MTEQTSSELQNFLKNLGYPFDSISGLLDSSVIDRYLNSKWEKSSHAFAILDKEASDQQLLACSDVSKFYPFIPPFFAALSSSNGLQAIKRLAAYEKLVGPIVMGIFEEGKNLRIHISYLDDYRKYSRFSLLVDQISVISLLRTGTNSQIIPVSIGSRFKYGPVITEYLGISPQKSRDNYLVFKLSDLKRSFSTENDVVWSFMEPGLKKYLKKLNADPPFVAVVQNTLFKLIAGGNFQLKDVAEAIKISPRTLQRWLKREGTSFKEQVTIVQKILALNLLQDLTLTTTEVSFLVGFSNVTSFYKAFKRWTGKTVLTYRHQIILEKSMNNDPN